MQTNRNVIGLSAMYSTGYTAAAPSFHVKAFRQRRTGSSSWPSGRGGGVVGSTRVVWGINSTPLTLVLLRLSELIAERMMNVGAGMRGAKPFWNGVTPGRVYFLFVSEEIPEVPE